MFRSIRLAIRPAARPAALTALALTCAVLGPLPNFMAAEAQEALAAGGPYKLVSMDPQGALVLSGLKRGSEPESVEAWLWTIYPAPQKADGELRDAVAQEVVLRCSGRSVESLRSEYYLGGEGRSAPADPAAANKPSLPKIPRAGTPQELVWETACDSMVRFKAKTFTSMAEVKSEIGRRFGPTALKDAQ